MMILLSAAQAQNNVLPVEDFGKDGAPQAVQKALDDRFSVYGGTVSGSIYVSTTLYVQGSPVATTGSAQTWTQPATFNSSVTFNGGVFGTINRSSYTYVPETVVTANSFTTGVATVTLTVQSTPLRVVVSGSMINNSAQESCWTVFVDGDYATSLGVKLNATTGMMCHRATASICFNASGSFLIDALSAGSHRFTLVPATAAGTNLNFLGGTTLCDSAASKTVRTQFGIEEFH